MVAENLGTAEINGTGNKAVGIYSENTAAGAVQITNDNKIDLAGEQSIGIYASGNHNISNTGNILIGNSSDPDQPGVGIYQDGIAGSISNTGNINVYDGSVRIYAFNGNLVHSGIISSGDGGIGIYADNETVSLNISSDIKIGN